MKSKVNVRRKAETGMRISSHAFIACMLFGLIGCTDKQTTVQPPPADTAPRSKTVEVAVKGTIDTIDNSLGLLDSSVKKGSIITAVYRLNLSAKPSVYSQPHSADYYDAAWEDDIVIIVGNYTFRSGMSNQLSIVNDAPGAKGRYDGWSLFSPSSAVEGPAINAKVRGFISLADPTATAMSSTSILPVPSLASWSSKRIGVARQDEKGVHLLIAGEIGEIRMVKETTNPWQ